MLTTNRRVAYALLWVLNHIPFYRNRFEVQVIEVTLDEFMASEAEWTPEDRMQLHDLLKDTESQ